MKTETKIDILGLIQGYLAIPAWWALYLGGFIP